MIKPILLAALLAAPVANAGNLEYCVEIEEYAEMAFAARQLGISASDTFSTATNKETSQIAHDAYTSPRYYSEEGIETARQEFKTKWFTWCNSKYNLGAWE